MPRQFAIIDCILLARSCGLPPPLFFFSSSFLIRIHQKVRTAWMRMGYRAANVPLNASADANNDVMGFPLGVDHSISDKLMEDPSFKPLQTSTSSMLLFSRKRCRRNRWWCVRLSRLVHLPYPEPYTEKCRWFQMKFKEFLNSFILHWCNVESPLVLQKNLMHILQVVKLHLELVFMHPKKTVR